MLVENEKANGRHRCHQQGKRLPLSARKRTHEDVQLFLKPKSQGAKHLGKLRRTLAVHGAAEAKALVFVLRKAEILENGQIGAASHGGILIHSADLLVAAVFGKMRNVLPVQKQPSALHGNGSADDVEHRGLSASVRADNRNEFAVRDLQGKILKEAVLGHLSGVIDLGDALKL